MSTQISISPIYNIENQEGKLITTPENYSLQDRTLVTNFNISNTFTPFENSIEFTIYNINGDILSHTPNYTNYQIQDEFLDINYNLPYESYQDGNYISSYIFVQNRLSSNSSQRYYISEISSNRTEIRLDSTNISNEQIISSSLEFIQYRNADEYFPDFYINFGENKLELANNILLDTSIPEDPTVLIKLYNPLPEQYDIKSTLYISEFISNPVYIQATVTRDIENLQPRGIQLQGPNTNLDIKDQVNNSTTFQNIDTLKSSTSSSLTNQIDSLLAERSIQISVDYSDYNNFVYLSSAQTRLENFYYKLSLIEDYTVSASYISDPTSSYMSESKAIYDAKINEIITNFDGYEYYLYFESSSTTWPKSNPEPPFINFATGSTEGQDWLTGQLTSASVYDEFNDNQLNQAIPDYLRDDPSNAPLELFVDMLGQNYDSIWVYIKDITNKYNADNRIDYGVSKDLVADIIRDFGVKIYQNNFSLDNLYNAFLGLDPSGSFLLPFDSTNILPVSASSGYEYIETYVTASDVAGVGLDDINKRIYKRLYHNLPMLLKKKGTVEGLRILLRSYGIPDTILQINEFGGKDKINTNDWDYWFKRFNYKLDINTVNDDHIKTPFTLDTRWNSPQDVPATVAFRFKTADSASAITYPSQSLWTIDGTAGVMLEYSGSGFTSASYSGSIVDPDWQYALLHFTPNGIDSASIALPFLNNDWWTVAVTRDGADYTLYAANKIYSGSDGSSIGFVASSSINNGAADWENGALSFFPPSQSLSLGGVSYRPLTGSYQEIRYYSTQLNTGSFYDLVMNPQSIEGNYTSASFAQVAFRGALGGELYTGSISIHPAVTASVSRTSSFSSGNDFSITGSFTPNREYVFYDSPAVGIKNRNTDKIKQQNLILPEGDTLSQNISIQQSSFISQSYTNNLNLLEVAFSPQNEINNDIIESLGYFNIGEYIGDPRLVSSSAVSYPSLDELRDDYFKKYIDNYNELDFVRLIRFFDNSVFKMLRDFVPARTSLASGVVIKPHLLERQKYPQPKAYTTSSIAGTANTSTSEDFVNLEITASIGSKHSLLNGQNAYSASSDFESYPLYNFDGGTGGTLPNTQGNISYSGSRSNIVPITQSYTSEKITPSGSIFTTHNTEEEFFDGNFSGSNIVATTQSLNPLNPFLSVLTTPLKYDLSSSYSSSDRNAVISFLQAQTPSPGDFFAGFESYPTASFGDKGNVNDTDWQYASDGKLYRNSGTFTTDELAMMSSGSVIFVSASYDGALPESPFVDVFNAPSLTMNAHQGIYVDYTSSSPALLTSSGAPYGFNNSPGSPIDIGTAHITLHFEGGLTYKFVGINVNVEDKEGTDYTNAIQQVESFEFSLNNLESTSLISTKQGSTPLELTRYSTNRDFYALYLTTDTTNVDVPITGVNSQFLVASNTDREIILTPGNNIAGIPYNDYNALLNNYVDARLSTKYEDLDYTQRNLNVPVNINPVISSSADKAPVQDSNYTTARQINSRYQGSKLTSANYNKFTPASSGSQLIRFADGTTGTWAGDKSFGKTPSVNNNANIAFSVEYVNGLYPEIPDATAAQIKDFKIIFDENTSEIIDKSDSLFNFNVDQYLGFSQSLQIFPADNSPVETPNITSLSGDIGAPAKSIYFIQASQSFAQIAPSNGAVLSTSSQGIRFASTGSGAKGSVYGGYNLYYQTENKDGEYVQSVTYDTIGSASVYVSRSLLEGERWFCTLLTQSIYPLELYEVYNSSSEMEVFNSGGAFNHKEFNPFSLPAFGVYEISEVQYPTPLNPGEPTPVVWKFTSGSNVPENRSIGQDGPGNYDQGKSLAALIWKSSNTNTPILPVKRPDFFPSGLGDQGGIIYPSSFNARFKTTAVQLKDGVKEIAPGGATIQALPKAVSNTNSSTNPGGSTGGSSSTGGGTPQYPPFGEPGTAGEFREYGADIYRFGGNGWSIYKF
jgi:hypothetical protein